MWVRTPPKTFFDCISFCFAIKDIINANATRIFRGQCTKKNLTCKWGQEASKVGSSSSGSNSSLLIGGSVRKMFTDIYQKSYEKCLHIQNITHLKHIMCNKTRNVSFVSDIFNLTAVNVCHKFLRYNQILLKTLKNIILSSAFFRATVILLRVWSELKNKTTAEHFRKSEQPKKRKICRVIHQPVDQTLSIQRNLLLSTIFIMWGYTVSVKMPLEVLI